MFLRIRAAWGWSWGWYLSRRRVRRVLDRYLYAVELFRSSPRCFFCGINALIASRAVQLDQNELRRLCFQIQEHGLAHPNWLNEILPNERLHDFLKWVVLAKADISNGPYLAWEIQVFKQQIVPQCINLDGQESPTIPHPFS